MGSRFFSLFVFCVSLSGYAGSAFAKAIAEENIAKIHSYYQNSVKRLSVSGANIQDIEMACMGEIYLEWFYGYSEVIKQTDGLGYNEVNGYREAEQKAHLLENDRKAYDTIRPDVSAKILAEVDKRRGSGQWPTGPSALALDKPQDQELLENFKYCRDENFTSAIKADYDLKPGYIDTKVNIEISGYTPVYKPGEAPYHIPPYYGAIDEGLTKASASYENWLYEILTR